MAKLSDEDFKQLCIMMDEKILHAKFDKTYVGKVTAVNGNLADVKLASSDKTITNLKNETGKTLIVGSEVKLTALNNNINDLVISIKK